MNDIIIKFMVGGRCFKTPCKTVLQADSFTVKFFTGRHEVLATVSDKCYFSSIDNIPVTGIKTDFYIGEYNSKDLIIKLCDSFDSFMNTSIPYNEKRTGFLSVDHMLDKILEIVEKITNTEKSTEIALDMLTHGTTKTTEETTETKMTDSEVDYDVDMHIKSEKKSSCYWDSYTVKATTTDSAMDKALNRLMNEAGINKTSVDCIRVYRSGESEILKECCYEAEKEKKIPDLNNFHNALIKALGMTGAKEVRYTIQGVNIFFDFKGNMYKCYTPQSKIYKLSGLCFKLISWRDLKKDSDETDDNSDVIYTVRPPPESSLLNLTIK